LVGEDDAGAWDLVASQEPSPNVLLF
jgi:hypothetical protein